MKLNYYPNNGFASYENERGLYITDTYSDYSRSGLEARGTSNRNGMISAAGNLERIGAYAEAYSLLADASINNTELPEWMGEDLTDSVLLVERRIRHTGAELRMARFLGLARSQANNVIAVVENRMVSLLARSFPEVIIVDKANITEAKKKATCCASYERLAQFFGSDSQAIYKSFRPLCPPQDVLTNIVKNRNSGGKTVIGIAWHSINKNKQLPGLDDWACILNRLDAHYVSLQYDEISSGLAELSNLARCSIEGSNGIDQMSDIDGFSAQVASVDLVITISNTTAHMAGALGVPCIVLLDDKQILTWPENSLKTPYYPATELIRLNQRSWGDVFIELVDKLEHTRSL